MNDYSEARARYRRLFRLTFLPLVGCFIYALLLMTYNIDRVPIIGVVVGTLGALCFVTFAVNGIRLERFRCPPCSGYFLRGKRVSHPGGPGPCCRHCGLSLLD